MQIQNLLFVCSRNKRRSLTAEMIFRDVEGLNVKSCGTSPSSRVKINEKLIGWADVILLMEKKHLAIVREKYPVQIQNKDVSILHIPDDFEYMDEALIELLQDKCEGLLE